MYTKHDIFIIQHDTIYFSVFFPMYNAYIWIMFIYIYSILFVINNTVYQREYKYY